MQHGSRKGKAQLRGVTWPYLRCSSSESISSLSEAPPAPSLSVKGASASEAGASASATPATPALPPCRRRSERIHVSRASSRSDSLPAVHALGASSTAHAAGHLHTSQQHRSQKASSFPSTSHNHNPKPKPKHTTRTSTRQQQQHDPHSFPQQKWGPSWPPQLTPAKQRPCQLLIDGRCHASSI